MVYLSFLSWVEDDYRLLFELYLRGGGRVALIFFIPRGTKSGEGDIGSNNFGGC